MGVSPNEAGVSNYTSFENDMLIIAVSILDSPAFCGAGTFTTSGAYDFCCTATSCVAPTACVGGSLFYASGLYATWYVSWIFVISACYFCHIYPSNYRFSSSLITDGYG